LESIIFHHYDSDSSLNETGKGEGEAKPKNDVPMPHDGKPKCTTTLALSLLLLALTHPALASILETPSHIVEIYGNVSDGYARSLENVVVELIVDGEIVQKGLTLSDGSYIISSPVGTFSDSINITLRYFKFGHEELFETINASTMAIGRRTGYIVHSVRKDAMLKVSRRLSLGALVAIVIFLLSYVLIFGGVMNRTTGALLGGGLMLAAGMTFGFMDEGIALRAVDFNVIGLLLGMMIIVAVLRPTGFFEAVTIAATRMAHNNLWHLLVITSVSTAFISMFVDNVTTIILIVPITITMAESLRVDPTPLLLSEAILSNVGGVGTLVGDPPNVMIASAASLSFNDFIVNLLPVVLLSIALSLIVFRVVFRNWIKTEVSFKPMRGRVRDAIVDVRGVQRSLAILIATILFFSLQTYLPVRISTIALFGAVASLVVSRREIRVILGDVEWPALLFFAGLFILVEGLTQSGVLELVAHGIVNLSQGHVLLTAIFIIWISAVASSIVDNIPFVATMIPIVRTMGHMGMQVNLLWWGLALGAGFGGNGTPIGSSAGVITLMAADKSRHPIGMGEWLKAGIPTVVVSCLMGTLFLALSFLLTH